MNNPVLYNAAFSGALCGMLNKRVRLSSYTTINAIAASFANAVDAIIPALGNTLSPSQEDLMTQLSRSATQDLYSANINSLSAEVATAWQSCYPQLIVIPAGAPIRYIYPNNAASDIPTYQTLTTTPPVGAEDNNSSGNITNASGQVLIEALATLAGYPGLTAIPPSTWSFWIYAYTAPNTGISTITFKTYTRDVGGLETPIFEVTSADIQGAVGSPVLLNVNYNQLTPTPCAITDRIILKIYAQTTSGTNIAVHYFHDGTTHASFLLTPLP
jgi:hypothetical protein